MLVVAGLFPNGVWADGAVVDKIYHPYVDALEREIEYRSIFQDSESEVVEQIHKISLGRAFGENLFAEIYLIDEKNKYEKFELEAYELELKWQLSEQGEYALDWGLLFEYENEFDKDVQEVALGILVEREWQRWSGTANIFLIEEWGSDIENEFETVFALQARYRYSKYFEPAFEFYTGQNSTGIGPVIQGNISMGIRKNINWEAGVIFGISGKSSDQTFRFLLEYEF